MTVLFPYQREGVDALHQYKGRALLADEPGLGKTLQVIKYLQENPEARPAIVICPASVKWHWEAEAMKHCGLRSAVLEGFRGKVRKGNYDLYIANYDIIPDHRTERGKRKGRLEFLKSVGAKTIVPDEGHYIANPRAKRSKAVREICKDVPGLIISTGTPMKARPRELFNSLNLLWPDEFPSFWSFAKAHCNPKRTFWGWSFDGAANLDVLYGKLKKLGYIRRKKWQVLDQLPKLSKRVFPVPIEKPEEYASAKSDFVKWLRGINPQAAKRAEKARMLAESGYLLRLTAKLKMPAVVEWIDDFLQGEEKLAVFGIHKSVLGALAERYGKGCVTIDGSVHPSKRDGLVERFRKDKRCRLFLGNVQAAGVGLNGLQKACSTGVLIEFPWGPEEVKQVIGRLDRIGQTKPVTFHMLVAKGTIEENLCKLLQKKAGILSLALDGKKTKELNIHDELLKELSKEGSK